MANLLAGLMAASAMLVMAGAAQSAPEVEIRHAAARVTVIPEARADVEVSVLKSNPRFKVTVAHEADTVVVDGGLGWRWHGCGGPFGHKGVMVMGVGPISYDALPQIIVRTPMAVKVRAGDAVFGVIGRSASLELGNAGCGDWTVGNVAGPMSVRLSGSGDLHAGDAATADIRISGSADAYLVSVRSGLGIHTSGSGDVRAQSVTGPLSAHISGSGDVDVRGGAVSDMEVGISGSGDVAYRGVAQSLKASVAGSGDVTVGQVTGPVSQHVAGSGSVRIVGLAPASTPK